LARATIFARTTLPAWIGVGLLLVSTPPGRGALAQEAAGAAQADAEAPAPPSQASEDLDRALREARKRLETAQSAADKETQEAEGRITEGTSAVLGLRDAKKKLLEKAQALRAELASVEAKLSAAGSARETGTKDLAGAREELYVQVGRLKERMTGSLVTAQDEQLLDTAGNLRLNPKQSLAEQIEVFFELGDRVLSYGSTSALIQIPLRIAEAGDRIETLKVLRFGLLGGYFSRPANPVGGIVLADPTTRSGYLGETRGLTSAQKLAIFGLLQKPDRGGFLPFDTTGGAAIVALSTADSAGSWFRKGGFWMWPIAILAAIAAIVVLERAIYLLLRFLAIRVSEKRIGAMARSGRIDPSGVTPRLFPGPSGQAVQSALLDGAVGGRAAETAAEEAVLRAEGRLAARLPFLSLVAAVCPLLGFLGTVTSLSSTFLVLGSQASEASLVGTGLAQALVTTQAGLYVAIPCLFFRGLLGAIAERLGTRLDAATLSLLTLVWKEKEEEVARPEVGGRI